ncbi:MAG: hypothetical protein ABUL71_01340 [Gemmatimonadota bacterium]
MVVAACHSDPFEPPRYGSDGAFAAGPAERLTFTPTNQDGVSFAASVPQWADGAAGIIYSFSPRPHQIGEATVLRCVITCVRVAADPRDQCVAMLPPTGGSAYWYLCEDRPFQTDSTNILTNATLNSAGELLYIEMTGRIDINAPLAHHADLWLGNPERIADRRHMLTLYHDIVGRVDTSQSVINWVSEIQWSGTRAFYALGQLKVSGLPDSTIAVVRGDIGASGATLSPIAATLRKAYTHMAVIEHGAAILVSDTTPVLRRVSLATGATTAFATMPIDTTGRALAISCRPDACALLTRDGPSSSRPTHWDIWRIDLASAAITPLRSYSRAIGGSVLSPSSGDLVIVDGKDLFLLPKAVP